MSAPTKTTLLTFFSLVAGIGTMYLFHLLGGDEPPAEPYDFLWEKVFVSAVMLLSFVCGFLEPRAPWRWPLVMAYAHYFSGFYVMKHWGQIPPLELIYIGLLTLPAIVQLTWALGLLRRLGASQGQQTRAIE